VVTFAAETSDVLENAKRKLLGKGCDLVVANDVSRADIGFDVGYNEVVILGPAPDRAVPVSRAAKREIARAILDRVVEVRRA
jgi:phosphopantothenoylcysteine synthetase/decarboxylase